jgi:hypothetical protein
MNDELETIKRRVKKLLALSKSSNENEAMAAPGKTQELTEEYRLDENENDAYAMVSKPATVRLSNWRARCLSISQRRCRTWQTKRPQNREIKIP